jgi:hypothetical protein
VAQDELRVAGRYTEILEQSGGCVPQVVHLDGSDFGVGADTTEGADEVARLDGFAAPGGKDESAVLPCLAQLLAVSLLCSLAEAERADSLGEQGQVAAARVCLDGTEPKLATDALELLTDSYLTVAEVGLCLMLVQRRWQLLDRN